MSLERAAGEKLLIWFDGSEAPDELLGLLRERPIGGVTLFRHLNGGAPAQVRALTAALQRAARADGRPPLLICADQEGGQLQAIGGCTAFPGNMALGATGDADLARRVGAAMGAELAAVGVNVNYAPACDVNLNPRNPVIGTRSFGAGPAMVARLSAAVVDGLQGAGVAAVAKHFPGHGDTAQDSHHALAALPHTRARLDAVELPPFVAAIAAGARLVMTAHLALPAITGDPRLPATLAPQVLRGLLRDELGFGGVVVSDAMNMDGLSAGGALGENAVRAAAAGVDLLLLAPPNDRPEAYAALLAAVGDGRLSADELRASAGRVRALKGWLAEQGQPALSV
ncbi:MAG: glycoside hydrolase family 3 protein, partial [Chloroflexales bacterium]